MRLPAEWEKQGFVQLTWPHEETAWYELPKVLDCYVEVAKAIARYEPLLIVCRDIAECKADMAARHYTPAPDIRFVEAPINDTWARDHGAISVFGDRGEKCIEDFVFNGWGLKFGADLDNQITRNIYRAGAFAEDVKYLDMRPFVLEGGSIDTDGAGTLMATSECLCSLNRNEYLAQEEIEEQLKTAFGLERILWVDHGGIAGDDTDSHIDTLARFCSTTAIAYVAPPADTADPHHDDLAAMQDELRGLRTATGKPYDLIPLPMPDPVCDPDDGHRLPATYANFLILNKAVLMPTYAQPDNDALAHRRLAQAFPRKAIIDIDARTLVRQHGSIHCSAMQFPVGVMA